MPDYTSLYQQVLQQYGLPGLVITLLLVGPVFTFLRTRNLKAETEVKTQDLLNEFARQERARADRLEVMLNDALTKLDQSEHEVIQLRQEVSANQRKLDEVPMLRAQIQALTGRVTELEGGIQTEKQKNQALQGEIEQRKNDSARRDARIEELESRLGRQRDHADPQANGMLSEE